MATVTSWQEFLGHIDHSVIRAHVVSRVDPLLHLKHLPGKILLEPSCFSLEKNIHLKVVARDFPDFCTFRLSSEQDDCVLYNERHLRTLCCRLEV